MQERGENWVGREARAVVTASELEALQSRPYALTLLAKLRLNHACRDGEFYLSTKMADVMGWTPKRFRSERDFLVEQGFLEITHEGGRGAHDAPRAVLK